MSDERRHDDLTSNEAKKRCATTRSFDDLRLVSPFLRALGALVVRLLCIPSDDLNNATAHLMLPAQWCKLYISIDLIRNSFCPAFVSLHFWQVLSRVQSSKCGLAPHCSGGVPRLLDEGEAQLPSPENKSCEVQHDSILYVGRDILDNGS